MRALLVVAAVVAAGCAAPEPAREVWVGPPQDGGGPAPCASHQAREMAVPGLSATAVRDAGGRAPGIHRLDAGRLLWVWASYQDTEREDSVSRVGAVGVHREPDGLVVVCGSADLAAPLFGDGTRRTYDVAVLVEAPGGFPGERLRVVFNWVAGCSPCEPLPRGNATATFP